MYEETKVEATAKERNTSLGILPCGTVLRKRYKIKQLIAQGGFGVTYLAADIQLSTGDVAIKEFFMSSHCGRSMNSTAVTVSDIGDNRQVFTDYKAKFIKEAKIISQFQKTPGIVKVLDIFEENNTAYYVMNYIDGQSLQTYIENNGKLPVKQACDRTVELCLILKSIHNKNCLHLDIKPSNIMIDNNGKLILIDFGVSKHYNSISGEQTTKTPVAHSPGYAPLEQYRNEVCDFTPATDIYSIGGVLYFMLCGKRPPEASVDIALDYYGINVPQNIKDIINRLMAPSRKKRPQTVEEVIRLIDTHNQEESVNIKSDFKFEGTINNDEIQELIPTKWLWIIVVGGIIAFVIFASING